MASEALDRFFDEELSPDAARKGIPIAHLYESRFTYRQYQTPYAAIMDLAHKAARRLDVLDWGVGYGHFSWFLTHTDRFNVTMYGTEGDARYLGHLQERGAAFASAGTSITDNPVTITLPDQSFDVVFSSGVLEHVHQSGGSQEASMAEVARLLRPGGRFVCFHFPNRGALTWRLSKHAKRVHDRTFGPDEVRALMRGAGLEIEHMHRYNFLPRNMMARLSGMPGFALLCGVLEGMDSVLSRVFPWLCTNWLVVARRPEA